MTTSTLDRFHLGHRPAAFVPEPKSHENASSERRSAFAAIAAWFSRLVDTIERANQRKVLHQQLITLDDRLLADIGIHRGDIPRLVADSYRTYTQAPEVKSAETRPDPRPDPLTIEEDLAVVDVPANDAETPRAA
ncbi:MAG: DUF1127 domain-containing protein [Proteobacteria bacterium]|nr:DUF1127 domain-containing protein [Pseudomonadota bacterium]